MAGDTHFGAGHPPFASRRPALGPCLRGARPSRGHTRPRFRMSTAPESRVSDHSPRVRPDARTVSPLGGPRAFERIEAPQWARDDLAYRPADGSDPVHLQPVPASCPTSRRIPRPEVGEHDPRCHLEISCLHTNGGGVLVVVDLDGHPTPTHAGRCAQGAVPRIVTEPWPVERPDTAAALLPPRAPIQDINRAVGQIVQPGDRQTDHEPVVDDPRYSQRLVSPDRRNECDAGGAGTSPRRPG